MVVAAGTAERQAQKHRAGRGHAIDHRLDAKLFGVGPPFFVLQRVAVKAGGDPLIDRGLGQHVAGELLDREPIERHVGVQGVDYPIAILPDRAGIVVRVAVAVGVTRQVEPVARLPLAVMGRSQQPVDQTLVGSFALVGQKRLDLVDLRRDAEQIQTQPADQGHAVRLGRGANAFPRQSFEDERVDRISDERGVRCAGRGRPGDLGTSYRLERPVVALPPARRSERLIVGRGWRAAVDPAADRGNLLGRQSRAGILGGHGRNIVGAGDRLDEQAFATRPAHDRGAAIAPFDGQRHGIEPQARLLLVGPVAFETIFRQDRPHVARVIDRVVGLAGARPSGREQAQGQPPGSNGKGEPRHHSRNSGRAG